MKEKVYIVIAYRWGSNQCHSYLVGASRKKAKAIQMAEKEAEYRGGKYGCWVYEQEVLEKYDPEKSEDMHKIVYKAKSIGD